MTFQPGEVRRFAYPYWGSDNGKLADTGQLPEYESRRGHRLVVVRECTTADVDEESLPMFIVRDDTGWEGQAHPSELVSEDFTNEEVEDYIRRTFY